MVKHENLKHVKPKQVKTTKELIRRFLVDMKQIRLHISKNCHSLNMSDITVKQQQ